MGAFCFLCVVLLVPHCYSSFAGTLVPLCHYCALLRSYVTCTDVYVAYCCFGTLVRFFLPYYGASFHPMLQPATAIFLLPLSVFSTLSPSLYPLLHNRSTVRGFWKHGGYGWLGISLCLQKWRRSRPKFYRRSFFHHYHCQQLSSFCECLILPPPSIITHNTTRLRTCFPAAHV